MEERQTGIVKWFNDPKGYGFIERDGRPAGEKDVFVHHYQIQMKGYRTLNEGERVEYTPVEGVKGTEAHKVVRLDAAG